MAKRNKVVDHGERGLYSAVPAELVRDKKLSPAARGIAAFIWSHRDTYDQSATSVAKGMGINRRTVSAGLLNLQQRGWLIREVQLQPGKESATCEIWHRQVSNTPFTPEEILKWGGADAPGLSAPESIKRGGDATRFKKKGQPCAECAQGTSCRTCTDTGAETARPPVQNVHDIEVHTSSTSEGMHSTVVQQDPVQNLRMADAIAERADLNGHQGLLEPGGGYFGCEVCGFGFAKLEDLDSHDCGEHF